MKILQDRREIADAINIKKYPVITVDISQPLNGDPFYKDCYGGSKVVVASPSKRYPDAESWCSVKMFGDEDGNKDKHETPWMYKKISLSEAPVCISSSFGLSDVREMVGYNNAPHVKADDLVVVFFDRRDRGWLRLMKVTKYKTLVDVDD